MAHFGSIPCFSGSLQATQPLSDVEIAVVDGGDFVVMLVGHLVIAEPLGDASQAIMQGEEVFLVLGLK